VNEEAMAHWGTVASPPPPKKKKEVSNELESVWKLIYVVITIIV
jgi:hypothetical protein